MKLRMQYLIAALFVCGYGIQAVAEEDSGKSALVQTSGKSEAYATPDAKTPDGSPALRANCRQSFDVDHGKSLPTSVAVFGGTQCPHFEQMRAYLFVDRLSDVSDATFDDFAEWKRTRDNILQRVIDARDALEDARGNRADNARKEIVSAVARQVVSTVIVALGCGPFTAQCVAALIMPKVKTVLKISAAIFDSTVDEAKAELDQVEETLRESEDLGESILTEARQSYNSTFEDMCDLVQDHCLR